MEEKIKCLYILEDPQNKNLSLYLSKEGIDTSVYLFNPKILSKIKDVSPHVIVFDFDKNEAEFIEQLHLFKGTRNFLNTKIVFYTTIQDPFFELACYEAGIDLFIHKPKKNRLFYLIISKLSKKSAEKVETTYSQKGLVIDREKFLIFIDGSKVNLSKKEFELIELLNTKPGKVYTRDEIANLIWDGIDASKTRTIDVHIRKLRDKIGSQYIKTIKGIGYLLNLNIN
jgi:two-component system alkaline phosphatase synthesis response regulator PhoP